MAYDTAEQLFIDQAAPITDDQWIDIHAILSSMARAGWLVNDSSNAPYIALIAFIWNRSAKWADFQTQIRELTNELDMATLAIRGEIGGVAESIKGLTQGNPATSVAAPLIDIEKLAQDLGPYLQAPAQVNQHYDVADSVKDALHKSFRWTWVVIVATAGLLASVFWTRMYIQDSRQIDQLSATNVALVQQLKGLQGQPARRADHKHP